MAIPLEAAIVRIWNADKRVVGAGMLVTDTLILTCAHVVAQALGIPGDTPEMPTGEIGLDFPLVAAGTMVTARVSQWLPVQPDGSGDLACLKLLGSLPKDAQPVPLMAAADLWGHPFRAFGFPAGYGDGVWASGRLLERETKGWIQIEDVKQTGYFIEPGFSGTPVWDETVQGVVGITVAAERQREVRAAFVIPVPAIIVSFPDLQHVVRAAPPPTKKAGGDRIAATVGNVSDKAQVAIGKEIQQNITIHKYAEPPASVDPTPLREAYLNGLLQKTGNVPLADIDPKMPEQDPRLHRLNLDAIYTALLTLRSEEYGRFREGKELSEKRKSALEQLDEYQHLILLGGPGSGKSTFVNFVTMCLAGEWLQHPKAHLALLTTPLLDVDTDEKAQPQPWRHGALLPVYVILRDFAAAGLPAPGEQATWEHLWKFIVNTLPLSDYGPFLQQHLLHDGGLILLDGLDEIPQAEQRRRQIKQAIESFASTFGKCRMLVTSRTYAYQQPEWKLSGFTETTLSTFTQDQIRSFVKRWYAYIAPFRHMSDTEWNEQAEELTKRIFGNPRLQELAERPLLLTLMASLHASRGKLPEKREELYRETVDLLLYRWEWKPGTRISQGKTITENQSLFKWLEVDRGKILGVLGKLAYKSHADQPAGQEEAARIAEQDLVMALWRLKKARDVTQEQIVDHLRDRAGLLISPEEGIYTFPHRSFQEYLAAYDLTSDHDYPKRLVQAFRKDPNRWREVLLLAAAKAACGSIALIWTLVDRLCPMGATHTAITPPDVWGALLAGQVLQELHDIFDIDQDDDFYFNKVIRVKDWLVAILTEQVPKEHPFPTVERALAGNILAVLGDPRPGVGLKDGLPDIEWCEVPEGTFLMGSDPKKDSEAINDEQPQHKVTLSAYQISRYLVTNAQYQTFVEDGGYTEQWQQCWIEDGWEWKEANRITGPEHYGGAFDLPNHPVVGISWYEAMAFCQWLMLRLRESGELLAHQEIRLPTEAQWEKAARSTDGRVYPWGDEITPEHANYVDTGLGTTSPVGCFPRGTSPYGCEDLSGNVYEWCLDRCDRDDNYNIVTDTYKDGVIDPVCLSGSARVPRGGYWILVARLVRAAYRYGLSPGRRVFGIGFRLVRTPS